MRIVVTVGLVVALVAGAYYAFVHVRGIRERNAFVEELRAHLTRDVLALGHYASDDEVLALIDERIESQANLTRDGDDAVVLLRVPVKVDRSCRMKEPPPELDKLTTLDRGNVKNLAIRCVEPLDLIGVKLRLLASGRPFLVEAWTYTAHR